MSLIQVNHHPSRANLAVFGLCWLVFFGLWGVAAWRHSHGTPLAYGLWIAAVAAPLIGLLSQEFLRLLYVGMSYVSYPIGVVISFVLLAIIYFGVFTPVGLLMRLVGHDPMHRRFDRSAATYWVAHEQHDDKTQYFKQF